MITFFFQILDLFHATSVLLICRIEYADITLFFIE